jgi:hypothetical protein
MSTKRFTYPAVRISQSETAPPVIFFAALCTEMSVWAGIPQKKKFGEETDQETVGFQRQENKGRVNELLHFYSHPQNVIQNPILCASRNLGSEGVSFTPLPDAQPGAATLGTVTISVPNFDGMTMRELFGRVRQQLEKRVPELSGKAPPSQLVEELKRQLNSTGTLGTKISADFEDELEDDSDFDSDSDSDTNDTTASLFEESHITDFWEEISARHEICNLLPDESVADPFCKFSRELLVSYLQPTVVVDGQHRLKGALAHADSELNNPASRAEAEQQIVAGKSPAEVDRELLTKVARTLPVSLLLSEDPAEQVFQFVVVNQKATPIGKALLGTIVSTTLGEDELAKVSERLKKAGIPLEESRAISLVVRSKESPFYGKVQRGIDSNKNDLLEWNVLGQVISIFKNLEGGRLYGENNDYASLWGKKFLASSNVVAEFSANGFESPKDYWTSTDGPWLKVFTSFWNIVKTRLSCDDPEEGNYWGSPRKSNLFNKISLTILSADFFLYLYDKDKEIDSLADVEQYTKDWLGQVSENYFKRDWDLSGVKKETTGIKKRWASMWKEYRKNPTRLPQKSSYRLASN